MKRFVRASIVASLFVTVTTGGNAAMAPLGSSPPSKTSNSSSSSEKVSRAASVPLEAAQKAIQAGDMQTAMAQIKIAQALPDRTPYDDYIINRFLSATSANLKDYATSAQAFDALIASPELALQPVADQTAVYHDALLVNVNVQHWQPVIADGTQLEALKGNSDTTYAGMAVAYYNLKDIANAQTYAQKSIDMAKAAGKQPDQAALQIVMNSAAKANNRGEAEATLETMVVTYNSPENWSQLTELVLGSKGLKDTDELYVFRLRYMTSAMTSSEDFLAMASLANQLGYSTEALAVLQQGINSGKISGGQAGAQLTKARTGANQDERVLSGLASAAAQAKSGEQDVKMAEDYWGYGRYSDAEASARRAISKGGLKDPSEGAMILGMALIAQNKNDDAIQTFGQVSGSEGRSKVAHIWSLYAQAKKKQATPGATR